MALEKITFTIVGEDEPAEGYIVEETIVNQVKYLLVADDDSDESDAYMLKEIALEGDDAVYEAVEDDVEFDAIAKVFSELLEDTDLITAE